MDLGDGASLLYWALNWRVLLCIACTALVSVTLMALFPWITVVQGIVIGLLGFVPGVAWQHGEASPAAARPPRAKTAPATALVAAFICGGLWGAASGQSPHAFVAGASVFVVCALVWLWLATSVARWQDSVQARLNVVCAGTSFAITAMVANILA